MIDQSNHGIKEKYIQTPVLLESPPYLLKNKTTSKKLKTVSFIIANLMPKFFKNF